MLGGVIVATVAAPLGLAAGGPLIELTGVVGGLALSGVLTLLLLPIAVLAVLRRPASGTPAMLGARELEAARPKA
ncbi:hypothetical protein ACFQ1L_10370 [Phytohabitans flavus]|uniref:hypothetical protein n=1 Tax=Phytohabitans flavus TaxID=1076124 RepID=UPI00363A61A6